MSLVYVLAPMALLIASAFIAAFAWAAMSGQYDDLDTPPQRILLEEDENESRQRPYQ